MLYIAYAVLWLLRFALGACVFSFLGVVVWRLPRRESVVKGRSHCPVCGRTLSAAELIPCLSYLLQGGKCRGCGAKIPARDFWIEVLGGLCSCACAYAFGGETARAALSFAVLGILTVVAFMDIDTLEIYDRFPALLLVCGAAAQFVFPGPGIKSRLLGCVIVSLPMLLLALVVPGGFGGGVLFQQHEAAGRLVGFPQSEDALRQLLFAQSFQHLRFRLAAGRCALKCKYIVAGGVHPARPGAA